MKHAIRARHALLTALGLLPLACGVAPERHPGADDDVAGVLQSTRPEAFAACGVSTPVPSGGMEAGLIAAGGPPQLQPVDTGLERCESGVIHRPAPVTCQSALPRPVPAASGGDAGPAATQIQFLYSDFSASELDLSECSADADCDDKPFGYCAPMYVGGGFPGLVAECRYGCVADADCGAGFVCECGDPVGQCVAAACVSDEDCGDKLCAAWFSVNACGETVYHSFACQTADDECATSADCAGNSTCGIEDGTRRCQPGPDFVCGRPFLVQDTARMASLVFAGAPGAARAVELGDAHEQLRVAEYWSRAGLMEHASIAAFARFALQLLHLGAPPELLDASQLAMRDETEHARLCFELAQRYLGTPVGAGPLPMDGALLELDFERIVALCFREGCVGETVAALEARVAREHATDSHVRQTLDRIAPDEERHAELAWKLIRWALSEKPATTRALLERELRVIADELSEPAPSTARVRGIPEHGVLADSERSNIRRAALREIVLPCAEAVLCAARSSDAEPRLAADA
jgi:hypothetical protein